MICFARDFFILRLHSHPVSECHTIEVKQKLNVFSGRDSNRGNKANLNAALITLLKVNLAHLQIVIAFYGHTLAGGRFISSTLIAHLSAQTDT